uniref:SFRICE_005311 n=1 Tax=Spodoptera frugiperda TaxID=7108 RepID=A0A2H1WID9_SPOFR
MTAVRGPSLIGRRKKNMSDMADILDTEGAMGVYFESPVAARQSPRRVSRNAAYKYEPVSSHARAWLETSRVPRRNITGENHPMTSPTLGKASVSDSY